MVTSFELQVQLLEAGPEDTFLFLSQMLNSTLSDSSFKKFN